MEWCYIIFLVLVILYGVWKFFNIIVFGGEDDVKEYIDDLDENVF
ncbi:hypothetical protein [Tenacibaculum amylolyticum]